MAENPEIKTSQITMDSSKHNIKIASAPIMPMRTESLVKAQISAPSYFYSLRENDAPPFLKPGKEPKPKLVIGEIMIENDVVAMIAAADDDKYLGLKRFLGHILVEKQIILNYSLSEKYFLVSFLSETVDYAAQRDFNGLKLACLITIYLRTHQYFKWYYWQSPVAVWNYFKEIMIRHTIEDSPDGQQVFEPEECYDIMSHFHAMYLSNLPLVHILTFGVYRLRLSWPFKAK